MRDYGTIPTSFWTTDAPRLSNEGKLLALYMLSGPHTTQIGCFRLPDGYVSEDLSWPSETVAKGFLELFENGFATRDEPSKWVLIHRFLEANRIENPNQGKSAARLFAQVPDDAVVKPLLAKVLRHLAPHFPVEELNRFETLPERFPKARRNQEQEQEQEQDQEQDQKQDLSSQERGTSQDRALGQGQGDDADGGPF